MPEPDFGDLDAVAGALERRVPEAGPIRPLTLMGAGWFSVAVETASGLVFRLACTAATRERHDKEWLLLPLLRGRLPVAIPELRWRIEPTSDFPYGGLGYQKLAGEMLLDLDDLNAEQQGILIHDLAWVLLTLHRTALTEALATRVARVGFGVSDPYLEAVRADALGAVEGRVPSPFFAELIRWWDDLLADPVMADYVPVLTHGDVSDQNLLIHPRSKRLVGLIDWEHAAIGDPGRDFVAFRIFGWDFCRAVADEYEALGGLLGDSVWYRLERLAQLAPFFGVQRAAQKGDDEWLQRDIVKLRELLFRG